MQSAITTAIILTAGVIPDNVRRVGIMAIEIDGIKFIVNVWITLMISLIKIALYNNIIKELLAKGIRLPGV